MNWYGFPLSGEEGVGILEVDDDDGAGGDGRDAEEATFTESFSNSPEHNLLFCVVTTKLINTICINAVIFDNTDARKMNK